MNNKKPKGWTDEDEEGYQRYLAAWTILRTVNKPQQPVKSNKRYTPPKR